MPWVGRKCFQGLKILQRFWSGNGSCGLPKQLFVLLALVWAGCALWVQGYVWDLAEMGRQPSRAGSARGAAFQADVVLAWGSAGLRQDVPLLQRAESIEISNRLGMSESSYEFLGKRIWQWQDVLWAGSALGGGERTSLSHGLCWEPSAGRAAWLHKPLPLQDSARARSSAEGDHCLPRPLLLLLFSEGRSTSLERRGLWCQPDMAVWGCGCSAVAVVWWHSEIGVWWLWGWPRGWPGGCSMCETGRWGCPGTHGLGEIVFTPELC